MSLERFTDPKGYIVHFNDKGETDAGDSAQRTFSHALCTFKDHQYWEVVNLISLIRSVNDYKAEYYRHWDSTMWWGRPGTMSRDNFKPIMWAAAMVGYRDPIRDIKANKYFTWNKLPIWPTNESKEKTPDFVLPTIVWGAQIRSERKKTLLLYLCDLVDLIGTLILCVKSQFKPNETSSDLNQLNEIIFKVRTGDTFISVLSRYTYKWFRRRPTSSLPKWNNKFWVILNVYYWNIYRMPQMYLVYSPWIDKLL